MLRNVLSIVVGFVIWFAVATLGNLLLRAFLPGYVGVEKAMTFTLTMMIARLVLGAVSSLAAGAFAALIARDAKPASRILGVIFLLMFFPVHYGLWNKFPAWYHVVFLASLFPLIVLGAQFIEKRRAALPSNDRAPTTT